MRITAAIALGTLAIGPGALSAQRTSLAVGYAGIPGSLGDAQSDHGMAVRLGIDLAGARRLTWSLEGGLDRLNEVRRQGQNTCFLPSGATGTCRFDSHNRDIGWSLGSVLRLHARPGQNGPYALAGIGYLAIRQHFLSEARDSTGSLLANFSTKGTTGDGALQGHLGAGWSVRPAGSVVSVRLEGRATLLLHNYSGGPQWNWSPAVLLGIRIGPRIGGLRGR